MTRYRKGFTIIELTLAMTFVSVLLIAITLLTIYMSNIYTRGITMRQVNTAGQELANDLQRSVQAAQVIEDDDFVIFMDNGSAPRVRKGPAAYATAAHATDHRDIMGGRLCLQDKSYVWNTGRYLQGKLGNDSPNILNDASNTQVHLAQVTDADICTGNVVSDFAPLEVADSTEVLHSGDRNLAIHKFYVSGNTAGGLYAISFNIGTNRDETLNDGSDSCKPPSDTDSDADYCAVNRFDIVTRTVADQTGGGP